MLDEEMIEDEAQRTEQREKRREEVERPIVPAYTGPAPGRPRLVIDRMVLENFKSYAGTQEIGPFHKCFTAVVGPNGSGKCLAPETLVLMADASVRRADEILVSPFSLPLPLLTAASNSPETCSWETTEGRGS